MRTSAVLIRVVLALALSAIPASAQGNPASSPPPATATKPPVATCTDLSGKIPVPCPDDEGNVPQDKKPAQVEMPDPAVTQPAPVPAPARAVSGKGDAPQPVNGGVTPQEAAGDTAPAPSPAPSATSSRAWLHPNPLHLTTSPASIRRLPQNMVLDQWNFWTSPARVRPRNFLVLVPLGVAAGSMVASDLSIERRLPENPTTIKHAKDFGTYGAAAFGGIVGGAWVFGKLTSNDDLATTGLLSGEAAVDTLLTSYAIKYAAGRQRPLEGNGQGDFRAGGVSFPSEHSAAAWAIAAVVAHQYPGFATRALAYGGAAAMSASRVIGRQHFASDALVGSALGWFIGDQVYRAHHAPDSADYGVFVPAARERGTPDPENMGSPYVPLDSWVYPAFDRLIGMGYVRSGIVGLRPWTRMECARLVEEATENSSDQESTPVAATRLTEDLRAEFAPEIARRNGESNRGARIESLYVRGLSISGTPLRDGFHFGQTVLNDYGRPYGEGMNAVAGFSASSVAGPFAFYFRGEYQHAPAVAAEPLAARSAIADVDRIPVPPAVGLAAVDRLRTIEAYVSLNLHNYQLSFGKQSLWWGPGRGGPMLFSNNAEGMNMLRISRTEPVRLPSILSWLGPMRTEFFLGQVSGAQYMGDSGQFGVLLDPQPYMHGEKVSFRPTPNFEFSVSRTTLFSGPGSPFTLKHLLKTLWVGTTSDQGRPRLGVNDPGDRRSGFDFSYRIPGVRDYLVLYADSFTDDEISPIAYPRRSGISPGIYVPQFPGLRNLEFRAEAAMTPTVFTFPGFFYYNITYRSGYTNNGQLLGNWVGRQGTGLQLWSKYSFSPGSWVEAGYRDASVDKQLLQGGRLHNYSVQSQVGIGAGVYLTGGVQYEYWNFPLLSPVRQSNVTASFGVTYWPKWEWRF